MKEKEMKIKMLMFHLPDVEKDLCVDDGGLKNLLAGENTPRHGIDALCVGECFTLLKSKFSFVRQKTRNGRGRERGRGRGRERERGRERGRGRGRGRGGRIINKWNSRTNGLMNK